MTLQEKRKKKGLSQSELAAVSGVKLRAIQVYEIGQRDINGAKLDTLCKLALALDCKVVDLLTDDALKIRLNKTV